MPILNLKNSRFFTFSALNASFLSTQGKTLPISEGFLLYPDIGICFLYNEIAVCQNLLLTYAENVIDYK